MIKTIFMSDIPASIATLGLCCYFVGMFFTFGFKPLKYCESFAVKPVDNAGVTEIRVYYGGISLALAGFLAFLWLSGHPMYSLIGGLFFSNTVFFTRTIFTFIDKGWKCPYTKLAIPAEGGFIVALWICFIISKLVY
ncbi:MAG: hypothetical protein RR357_06710 [Clostridia bacterium]